jgi:hypothetical protein
MLTQLDCESINGSWRYYLLGWRCHVRGTPVRVRWMALISFPCLRRLPTQLEAHAVSREMEFSNTESAPLDYSDVLDVATEGAALA